MQAEDGIGYDLVTGVQTCGRPICVYPARRAAMLRWVAGLRPGAPDKHQRKRQRRRRSITQATPREWESSSENGRASCRGRVEISGVAVSLKKKKTGDSATRIWSQS